VWESDECVNGRQQSSRGCLGVLGRLLSVVWLIVWVCS
jgi:hypothetical protein